MATDLPPLPSDARLLYEYLGSKIENGDEDRPAVEVLADLNAYSRQLVQLRAMVAKAEESLDQGLAKELDLDALLERVRQRMLAQDAGPE
jgi:hypothetical protein